MTRKMFLENEFSDNVIVIFNDTELTYSLHRFLEFVQMSSEEMTADMLIESMARLQNKKISMVLLEGQENIKKILNKSYELRRTHPDMQFILLLDDAGEAVNAHEHFSFVRFLKKSDVIERITLLMGYIHAKKDLQDPFHVNIYKPNSLVHHSIDRYV